MTAHDGEKENWQKMDIEMSRKRYCNLVRILERRVMTMEIIY